MEDRASGYLRLAKGLDAQRDLFRPFWDRLAELIMPRRVEGGVLPVAEAKWHSTAACNACNLLASGHMTYITPVNQLWFSYKPSGPEPDDDEVKWYRMCTEVARDRLSASNFYTALHECYIDRCLYGTGLLLCEFEDGQFYFKHIRCGGFSMAENSKGVVDTLVRSFKFSAQQAAEEFGEENLGPKLKVFLADEERRYEVLHEFVHVVRPRKVYDLTSMNPLKRRFESVYVCKQDKRVVKEEGYYEFPYMATRFLRWGDSPYGVAPGFFAEPDITRSIFLDEMQDVLAEVAAFPRVLQLAEQVGEVDLRAGGSTVVTREAVAAGLPREWATAGRYDVAMDRQRSKEERIEQAFHVDMLRVISSVDRQMTATEVMAREGEKVLAFSPSYTQMTSDLRPLCERVFALLFRDGAFPEPPECVVQYDAVRVPKLEYQNKVSAALDRLKSEGLVNGAQLVGSLGQVEQWRPALDVLDARKAAKEVMRSSGAPECVIKGDDVLELEDQARQVAAERERALMEQQMEARAGKDGAEAAKSAMEAGLL